MALIKNKRGKKTMTAVKKREAKNTSLYTIESESALTSNTLEVLPTQSLPSFETSKPVNLETLTTAPEKDVTENKTITIYVVGKFKRTETQGFYGISIYKQGKRKPENYSGCFESTFFGETQLKTLCHAISLIDHPFDYSVIEIVTDFGIGDKFSSGLVTEWKNKGWVSTVKKPISSAELYAEFLTLYQDYAITFTTPDPKDKKFLAVQTVLDQELKVSHKTVKKEVRNEPTATTSDQTTEANTMTEASPLLMEESSVTEPEPVATSQIPPFPTTKTRAIHVDHTLMSECEALFEQMGLDVDTAVTMLLKQALRNKGLAVQL